MKKLLALLLALTMVFALAACGASGDEEKTTTEAATDEVTEAPTEEATEAPSEDATEAATDENGEAVTSEEATEADEKKVPETTEEIVAYYNAARKATKEADKAPHGKQTLSLASDITGDGAIGVILKVLNPAVATALKNNSPETSHVPGWDSEDLKPEDVVSATAKDDGKGNVIINIKLKDQKDGSDGDNKNGGPVARGTGTLGSIDSALKELGAELTSGRDTVTLTYTDAYIKDVKVNQESGLITAGTWHYIVKVFVGNAKAKLGISANLENLKANIEYKVVAG